MAIDKRPNVLAAAPTVAGVPMPKQARFLAGIVSYVVLLVGVKRRNMAAHRRTCDGRL